MIPDPMGNAATKNDKMYQFGRMCLNTRARLSAEKTKKAPWGAVAAACGVPAVEAKAVKTAATFAAAVDLVETNCGNEARQQLLSDHPRLTPRVVMQIARTHADRQRYELAQVRAGRRPFAPPPAGVEPPFDTHNPAEVLSRLHRNAGALDWATDGLLDTPERRWPDGETVSTIAAQVVSIRRDVRAMRQLVSVCAVVESAGVGEARGRTRRPDHKAFIPERAESAAAGAAKVTAKNVRDFPRMLVDTPPTAAERDELLAGLQRLDTAAARLLAVARAGGHDPGVGPAAVPGTYVVFFRLTEDVKDLKVGALGTFDFPAGVYAYLGSAFGGGGVLARTDRHLTSHTPRKWNIDWLKPWCVPVAVWWTHDRDKVEFDWADVLARLPGASFPVRRFGGNDNPSAEAHLFRFDAVPALAAFRRRVGQRLPGHAPVYQKAVENWAGHGWPGCQSNSAAGGSEPEPPHENCVPVAPRDCTPTEIHTMTKTVTPPRAAPATPADARAGLTSPGAKSPRKAEVLSNGRRKYQFELLPGVERSLGLPLSTLRQWLKQNDDSLSHCVAEVPRLWRELSMPNWRFPGDCFRRAIQFLRLFGSGNAHRHNAVYVFGKAVCGGIGQHGWVELEDRVVFDGVQQQFYTKQGFYASQLARPWYRYTRPAVMALMRRKHVRTHFRWDSALRLPWASDPTNPLTVNLDMVKEILAAGPEPTHSEVAEIIDRLRE